jgi:Carbamoyl-phosphate synthase L chain, ATP binding domain
VHSLEEALERCARIGYPIMLKASWGGGGKGIRKVGCASCRCGLGSHCTCHAMPSNGHHAAGLLGTQKAKNKSHLSASLCTLVSQYGTGLKTALQRGASIWCKPDDCSALCILCISRRC